MKRRTQRDETGTGLLGSVWGVLAFLVFLFLGVQVAVNSFTTTTVTSLTHEAARRAALTGGTRAATVDAERWLTARIGPAVRVETLNWRVHGDVVRLDVSFRPPGLMIDLSSGLRRPLIERSVEVRTERHRANGP